MIDSDDLMGGEAVIEIVENQLAENNPARVKETLMRLMLEGVEREEAIQYIACALCVELVDVVNHQATFNEQRFNTNLDALPEMPWAEDL
ncbi:hypothetical protein [Endozoicomonas sp. SCSIO W0465]|uniref:hypothetical protein n=1 Tax=Endozoicomonas sp. SCSIO W0465 TaxID=2918516 RepID=UPI002076426A|nr:hypothetical protein [Endozoicomonas sp. SCSIO W0465]USE36170.1 hypothetical protein MJO57_29700 [Endozoicomonas sp. SCSIO W0465]